MNLRESSGIALAALRAQKLRSSLTLLGIIVGVGSVIAAMSLVQGLDRYVARELVASGANVFTIDRVGLALDRVTFEDRLRRPDLTRAHAARIAAEAPHVAAAVGERTTFVAVKRAGRSVRDVMLLGAGPGYMEVEDLPVARGRALGAADDAAQAATCVIGAEVADELFGALDPLGCEMRVAGQRLLVVGEGSRKGWAFGRSRDLYVIVPLAAFARFEGRVGSVDIKVRSRDAATFQQAQDEARAVLRVARHRRPGTPDDFEITTPDMLLGLWHDLSGAIFLVIVGVSTISLVVGGIVIMNIMLVSVAERTREIGLRKAVGARRRDVLAQFLIEAATLAAAGGVAGLALGAAFALLIALASPLPVRVSGLAVVLGLVMAVATGLFFGAYPATRAARLEPIDALRHE